jgi:DNA-binding transcriptional regulator LsrR (DeoR family)
MLPAPGVVGSREARSVLLRDAFVRESLAAFKSVTVALVGIGAVEPSKLLAASGNTFSNHELELLSIKGAVGDICLHFFNAAGQPVITPLDDRVISMDLDELRKIQRVIGVAGGKRKVSAIRGALAGKWVNVLVTDCTAAMDLLEDHPENNAVESRTLRTSAGGRASRQVTLED